MTVFLLHCQGSYALQKRPETGLLAGLWEFPHVPGRLELPEALAQLESWDIIPEDVERVSDKTHIFTHIQWDMHGWYIRCRNTPDRFQWAPPESRALPTAFRMFLDLDSIS